MRKGLSIFLCFVMILSVLSAVPTGVFAVEADVAETGIESGTTGDCTWTLDGTVLTISGKGAMEDYNVFGAHFGPWGASGPWGEGSVVTTIVISDGVTKIGDGAFGYCDKLTSVTMPKSVTRIGKCAFIDCHSLKSIVIGNGVERIDSEAFGFCENLASITIPDSVTSIANSAFKGTAWLNNQSDGMIYAGKVAYQFNGAVPETVTFKEGTLGIADSMFNSCNSIKSVTIPNSVVSIGDSAFFGCLNLKSVTIPESVTTIGNRAFSYFKWENGQYYNPIPGCTIYCVTGSAAYFYAKENGINYVAKQRLPATQSTVTVKTGPAIATPKIKSLTSVSKGVKITWGAEKGAVKYRVFRKRGSGSWSKLIDTTALSVVDKTAKSGTKYTYTIRCITKDGKGYTSDYDKTGKSILYLAQPKITKLENAAKGTKLTWSKSGGATSYKVYLKSGSSWKALGTVKANTYTYTKAKSGATYTYTVRAVSKDGKTLSAYNTKGWSKKFIAAPALPTLKNTKNGIQITIKKSAGAEKYRVFRKLGSGKWTKLADTTKLTVLDKTAKNGKTYSYTVRCISKDGKAYTSAYNIAGKSIRCNTIIH